MTMTKKDYELIEGTIAKNHRFNLIEDDQVGSDVASITRLVAQELATAFKQDNPKFDRERFLEGCGLGHQHGWFPLEVDADQPEQVYWCHGCDATKDSSGGIINQ